MASLLFSLLLASHVLLISSVRAVPRMVFPLNSQVSSVARVGQAFSFTFSATTFANDGLPLSYALQNAPAWLNIDSSSRTLYGTPGAADVGFPAFSVIAIDSTGRTSMPSTLVVVPSDHETPDTNADVPTTLTQGGRLSNSHTLTIMPKASFAFSFSKDTFKSSSTQLTYYSTLSDHTPLPSWLNFDVTNLRFSGAAPVLSASPQYFDVLLITTDVPGFATAVIPFTIAVSVHSFYFNDLDTIVTVGQNQSFDITNLKDDLVLDGQTAKDSDISKSAAQTPGWLNFDQKTLALHGQPPADFSDGSINIQIWSRFGDTANKTVLLRTTAGLLSTDFPQLQAKAGTQFTYTFGADLFKRPDLLLDLKTGNATWLHFDPVTRTLSGSVPKDASSSIPIEMDAKTQDGSLSDTRRFNLEVQSSIGAGSATGATPSNSHTSAATGGVFAATGTPDSTNTGRTVGMVIGVVMAIVAVICFLVFLVWYRRFGGNGKDRSRAGRKRGISRPRFDDNDPWSGAVDDSDLEKGSNEFQRSADKPPQVQLRLPDISPFKKTCRSHVPFTKATILPVPQTPTIPEELLRRSHIRGQSLASSTINNDDMRILNNMNRSSMGYEGTRRPHDSMKLPAEMARRSRLGDVVAYVTPDNKRLSRYASSTRLSLGARRVSSARVTSGGIPSTARVSGLGHGRSPANRNSMANLLQIQQQERTPSYADSVTTHSTSVLFSPRIPAPPPRLSKRPSLLDSKRSAGSEWSARDSRMRSAYLPVPRRAPHSSTFFSARDNSRGSSTSRKRGTILGLSTIHASPDPKADNTTPTDEPDGLGIVTSAGAERNQHTRSIFVEHPLRRHPTKTSDGTTNTYRTTEIAASDVSGPAPPIPARHPAHKRWSSQFRARLSRPISGASSRFADPDDEPHTMSGANVQVLDNGDDDDDDDASVYSQSSRSVSVFHSATPSPERERPPTRGKIPIGGVRVPPFNDPGRVNTNSIMNRPHPRVSIRKASRDTPAPLTPQKRIPLARVRGAENRLSGGGGGGGVGGFGLDKITMRPARLKSGRGKRPVSVNDGLEEKIRSVKGSVMTARTGSSKSGRAVSMSPVARGNECFL